MEEKIIAVAKQVFLEKGYEMTSMSDIAARVGINRPTLHYYFRTKERMFQAVVAPILDAFVPKIEGIIKADCPFMDKVERLIDAYMPVFIENPNLPRFVVGEMHRDIDNFLNLIGKFPTEHVLKLLLELLLDEMEKGNIRRVSLPVVMGTFYSQMTFPFLTENMLTHLFFEEPGAYRKFLEEEWKPNMLSLMRHLLQPSTCYSARRAFPV